MAKEQQLFCYDMATKFYNSSGTYLFSQPCRLWNEEYCHRCGYIHLLSSISSTRKKCCANGVLSSVSPNFDEKLMTRFVLDKMPLFMRIVPLSHKLCQDCKKYNNLLAIAATKVCNYCDTPGFTY